MNIEHLTGRINPVVQPAKTTSKQAAQQGIHPQGESFSTVLDRAREAADAKGLQFSSHAMKRLQDRDISMDANDIQRLQQAVGKAEEKGSKESLILDGQQAFIVNVPNNTVITAMDVMDMRERVFTNIDSTVFTNRT